MDEAPFDFKVKPQPSLESQIRERYAAGYLEGMASTIAENYIVSSMTDNERYEYIQNRLEKVRLTKRLALKGQQTARSDLHRIETEAKTVQSLLAFLEGTFTLQSAPHSVFASYVAALAAGKTLVLNETKRRLEECKAQFSDLAQTFIVQHDWAAAFRSSAEFESGDFQLPYKECVFEFRISGRNVLALCAQSADNIDAAIAVDIDGIWSIVCVHKIGDYPGNADLLPMILAQIKAISVALDAEIATTEVTRSEYRRNIPGKPALVASYSKHTLKLRRVPRAAPLPRSNDEPMRHVRLHFRRGHWRHLENHKVWVRWTLVGDPDLGFVDKDYCL